MTTPEAFIVLYLEQRLQPGDREPLLLALHARDRAIRAALLEELADEEHAAGWYVLFVYARISDKQALVDVAGTVLQQCQARETSYRRRAAAERGGAP